MTGSTRQPNQFVLEAFDRDQWCPVLQATFRDVDLGALRAILGAAAVDDPELSKRYTLTQDELAAVIARFGVAFDPGKLEARALDLFLFRRIRFSDAPYLLHTGYELPLLLDGHKKLARMSHDYPPAKFEGEDRFDYWVANGALHREEVIEPYDRPVRNWLGHRTVYYTVRGEEWRIPAMKLIYKASGFSGGWNEHFERLEGMLFGYEDWQNDWWINVGLEGRGFGGIALCCAVTSEGLAWIEASGFRALPPANKPTLLVIRSDRYAEEDIGAHLLENSDSAALVRFNVLGRYLMNLIDLGHGGPWQLSSRQIPEINRNLRGLVTIVARRKSPS